MEFNAILTSAGIILLVCFGSIILCAILGALGFREAGVLAGSCASGWQSLIGNVAQGTWFALAQSLAATGLLANCACLAAIVATATIIGLVYYYTGFDFGPAIHATNETTTALINNITIMADSINITTSTFTEPMGKFKTYFNGICENCTKLFSSE